MVTIFGTVVPSSEVNEQLTDDDLLSFMENQETALQDSYSPRIAKLDAYLADCNVNNCMKFWQENVNKFPKLPAASETSLHSRYIVSNGEMFQCSWLYRECLAIQPGWSDDGKYADC